jgi:hypothetical protein
LGDVGRFEKLSEAMTGQSPLFWGIMDKGIVLESVKSAETQAENLWKHLVGPGLGARLGKN